MTRGAAGDTLLASYNDLASVERVFDANRGQIAALIVEPIAGNMGLVPPADGFLDALRQALHRARRAADLRRGDFRISRGAGRRAGALPAIVPDLTCLGKIIGGGLPVGAYGGRADLMELVSPAGPVYQAGTLSGNPLAMTAGIWCLDRLKPRLYRAAGRARRRGSRPAWPTRRARPASPLQVNAFGSLLTPFFTDQPVRDYPIGDARRHRSVRDDSSAACSRGASIPPPSQFEAWFLSAAHTARDVDKTIAAAREAMKELKRGI